MPVPDSYSRRYGREETTYTSSYSTSRGTRSSYLSSYSAAKQSTSLPPRPPSIYGSDTYRKYGDSSSVTSRYLTSSTGGTSRIRDYGASSSGTGGAGGYRSSVSPVRATSALRSSITDRLKAMEIDGKDDEIPVRSSYTSRYSTLRSRDPVTSISSRPYASTYARDRSNSREYGTSPLSGSSSNLSSSQRERDPSLTRSSTENLKKRGSPSPTSTNASSSRKDSTEAVVANGLSSSEVNKTSSSSSSTSESATCASKGVAITTTSKKSLVTTTSCATTTISDTTDNSVVIVDGNNTSVVDHDDNVGEDDVNAVPVAATTVIVSDSSRAYNQCARDLENNDVESNSSSHVPPSYSSGTISLVVGKDNITTCTNNIIAISQDEGESLTTSSTSGSCKNNSNNLSLGMVNKMNNGNSSDDDGGSNKKDSNSVLVMVVHDRNNKKVKSVPSSSSSALKDTVIGGTAPASSSEASSGGAGGEKALGSSSSLSSASDSVFSSGTVKVMEKDSNGNPIPIMDAKGLVDAGSDVHGGVGGGGGGSKMNSYGTSDDSEKTSSSRTSSSAATVKVAAARRRRESSDSNANTLVDREPNVIANGKGGDHEIMNGDDENKISIKVNREATPPETFTIAKPRRSSAAGSAAGTNGQNGTSSSSPRSSSSRVIYHTIKVEDTTTKSPSPEPVFTVKAPVSSSSASSSASHGDNKQVESSKIAISSSSTDTTAEFKVSLPRRRSSAVKIPDLPSSSSSSSSPSTNENRHRNGNVEGESMEDSSIQSKLNSSYARSTNSPSKSEVLSHGVRTHRKSGSPCDKLASKNYSISVKNEEDSSSSVEDEQSEHDKPIKKSSPVPTSTSSRAVGASGASSAAARKSKSKSPAPRTTTKRSGAEGPSTSSSASSKYSSEGSANANGVDMGGPHTSKFAYEPSQSTDHSSAYTTNRNDRSSRYAHLTGASAAITSDSSDNDSDAFSSSPQSGNFRSRGNDRAGLTGLRNIGNTCFMNTVIQCLSNTRPLLEYLTRDNYVSDINTTTSGMKGCLIRAFSEVIQELWREQRVVDTSAFKDQIQKFAPRFMGYSQQDAQEFLRYLLEGLHEDVNRVASKPTPILTDIEDSLSDSQKASEAWKRYLRYENSRIVDIFVGQLRSTLKCTVCGNCSVTFDPFWDLSLPIPARAASTRLAQCFELFTKEEVLDGDEKPTCSKCQCRRKCTKSFSIQKFPRILVIHLKRFSPMERYRGKLSTLVDYPLNSLDLSPYAANRGQAVTYNLYGVANHSGSTYSGHYIAYCKHPYSGEWHCYNDSRVSPISSHSVISTEGYVLFYEQST